MSPQHYSYKRNGAKGIQLLSKIVINLQYVNKIIVVVRASGC